MNTFGACWAHIPWPSQRSRSTEIFIALGRERVRVQVFEAVDDVVQCPFGGAGQFDPVDPLDQDAQHGRGFQAGEALSGAAVGAVAEAELAGRVAVDVEGVRVVPHERVAVGGGVDDQYPCAFRDGGVGQFGVVGDRAGERAQGDS